MSESQTKILLDKQKQFISSIASLTEFLKDVFWAKGK